MAKASASKSRTCCGFIPMKTGVTILTIFGILNKLSGFYGLISFDFEDKIALSVYIYSLFALIVFGVGFYGIQNDNLQIVRWYTAFYWVDCVVSTATTILFAVKWYVLTDHSLPELADDPVKLKEHDDVFRMESTVSILILVILRLVHVYFAVIVTTYYMSMGKAQYTKLAAAVDEELSYAEHANAQHLRQSEKLMNHRE